MDEKSFDLKKRQPAGGRRGAKGDGEERNIEIDKESQVESITGS